MEITLTGGPYGGRSYDDDDTPARRFVLVGIQPDGEGGLAFLDERIEIYRQAGTTSTCLTYEHHRTFSHGEFLDWVRQQASISSGELLAADYRRTTTK